MRSLAVLLILFSVQAAVAQEPIDSSERISKFMRVKLMHSQKILEALTREDFTALAKESEQLKLLTRDASWNVLQTEQYLQHSGEFARRVEALSTAAKKKNLDGASLAFVEVTLSCVQCHKHVRDLRMGRADPGKVIR